MCKVILLGALEVLLIPFLAVAAFSSRLMRKSFQVGIGPEPIINNRYHKQALIDQGYTAQTFVSHVSHITNDFDIRADKKFASCFIRALYLYFHAIYHYECLYFYFNGGALAPTRILKIVEPWLYKLAGIRMVLMPYGADIQDMRQCPNLLFKHAISVDYPDQVKQSERIGCQIKRWTARADHIISGCDWVDYMTSWDTLLLSHIVIDTNAMEPVGKKIPRKENPFRILHAPNHRKIKGTQFFIEAVEELQKEGEDIELVLLERVSNEQVREQILMADLVADQLIIGWYAMFAIEAMAYGKPVLCYLREDLIDLYISAKLITRDEIPIIETNIHHVKKTIRECLQNRERLIGIGSRSRVFVEKHHSVNNLGITFDQINKKIGIKKK